MVRHFHAKPGTPKPAIFPLEAATSVQEHAIRPHNANLFRVYLDALGERAEVVAAVAARLGPYAPAGLAGDRFEGTSNLENRSPIIAVGTSNLKGLCC